METLLGDGNFSAFRLWVDALSINGNDLAEGRETNSAHGRYLL